VAGFGFRHRRLSPGRGEASWRCQRHRLTRRAPARVAWRE